MICKSAILTGNIIQAMILIFQQPQLYVRNECLKNHHLIFFRLRCALHRQALLHHQNLQKKVLHLIPGDLVQKLIRAK